MSKKTPWIIWMQWINKAKQDHKENILDCFSYRYCNICKRDKPPRCHHCKLCGRCCLKFDHHCPVVGCWVGYYNYKYFCQMSLFTFTGCFHQDIWLLVAIYFWDFGPKNHFLFTIAYTIPSVFLFLWCIFGACMVSSHFLLIWYNLSTIEWIKNYNGRIFDYGSFCKNYKDAFGDEEPCFLMRLMPLKQYNKPSADGYYFYFNHYES